MSDRFDPDNPEQEPTPPSALESPGTMLREARNKAGISQETVADQLNLVVAKVEALETDRYEKLASDVFAQGYLRRYSKLVGIDEDLIVERFRQWRADTQPPLTATESRRSRRSRSVRPVWLPIVLLIAVILLVAGFFYFRQSAEPALNPAASQDLPRQQIPAEPDAVDESQPEDDEVEAVEFTTPLPDASSDSNVDSSLEALAELPPMAEPTVRELDEQESAPATDSMANSAHSDTALSDTAELSFTFTDECWIEVRDASGQVLRAEVAAAGQSMAVEGEAPFSVMLGNARAANVSYNGGAVAINTRPGNRTARLTIGP